MHRFIYRNTASHTWITVNERIHYNNKSVYINKFDRMAIAWIPFKNENENKKKQQQQEENSHLKTHGFLYLHCVIVQWRKLVFSHSLLTVWSCCYYAWRYTYTVTTFWFVVATAVHFYLYSDRMEQRRMRTFAMVRITAYSSFLNKIILHMHI